MWGAVKRAIHNFLPSRVDGNLSTFDNFQRLNEEVVLGKLDKGMITTSYPFAQLQHDSD